MILYFKAIILLIFSFGIIYNDNCIFIHQICFTLFHLKLNEFVRFSYYNESRYYLFAYCMVRHTASIRQWKSTHCLDDWNGEAVCEVLLKWWCVIYFFVIWEFKIPQRNVFIRCGINTDTITLLFCFFDRLVCLCQFNKVVFSVMNIYMPCQFNKFILSWIINYSKWLNIRRL